MSDRTVDPSNLSDAALPPRPSPVVSPINLEGMPDEELRALTDLVLAEWRRRWEQPKKLADDLPPWEDRNRMMDGISSLDWAMMLETLRRDGSI